MFYLWPFSPLDNGPIYLLSSNLAISCCKIFISLLNAMIVPVESTKCLYSWSWLISLPIPNLFFDNVENWKASYQGAQFWRSHIVDFNSIYSIAPSLALKHLSLLQILHTLSHHSLNFSFSWFIFWWLPLFPGPPLALFLQKNFAIFVNNLPQCQYAFLL